MWVAKIMLKMIAVFEHVACVPDVTSGAMKSLKDCEMLSFCQYY